ncbi:hypothetical protein [Streptosporangium roseum]|uniref:hypothetical protein n=1 Tax=Streptosporangium roseum TaxID=2001 RepID=UPI00146F1569|nr:hypothetical protein [Streptosporangium roseum]
MEPTQPAHEPAAQVSGPLDALAFLEGRSLLAGHARRCTSTVSPFARRRSTV